MEKAIRVSRCESGLGTHPKTYDLARPFGGPFQIAKRWRPETAGIDGWEEWFRVTRGWTWDQVVRDVVIHVTAALEIYRRSGHWGPWPICGAR